MLFFKTRNTVLFPLIIKEEQSRRIYSQHFYFFSTVIQHVLGGLRISRELQRKTPLAFDSGPNPLCLPWVYVVKHNLLWKSAELISSIAFLLGKCLESRIVINMKLLWPALKLKRTIYKTLTMDFQLSSSALFFLSLYTILLTICPFS